MIDWFELIWPDPGVYDYVFRLVGAFLTGKLTNTFPVLYAYCENGKTTFRHFLQHSNLSRFTTAFSDNDITSGNINWSCTNFNNMSEATSKTDLSAIDNNAYYHLKIIPCEYSSYVDCKFRENTQRFNLLFILFLIPYAIQYIKDTSIPVPEIVLRKTREVCRRDD